MRSPKRLQKREMSPRFWACCTCLRWLAVGVCLWVLVKAFQLQVLEHSVWAERADAQTRTTLDVPVYRGSLMDRSGRLLAVSVGQPSLFADGMHVTDPKGTAEKLASILSEPVQELEGRLRTRKRFIWIRRNLSDAQALECRRARLPGVYLTTEYRRFYPLGDSAGQVLGFTGEDGAGLEGVERAYDGLLRQAVRKVGGFRDGGRHRMWLDTVPPPVAEERYGLKLTLDARIQSLCERYLEEAVREQEASAAEMVVLDARSFEVVAMANWPPFDPNRYASSSPGEWRNRAITDLFEPGSAFKVFLVAAALDAGRVRGNERIFCENGDFRLARHTIHDVHPHGWLTLSEVLKYSSNIGAAKLAMEVGSETYHRYIRAFGFGSRTGIDLPGEGAGLVRSWDAWRPIDLASCAFGQSLAVTTLQLTCAVGAIANGGLMGVPRVAGEAVAPDGRTLKRFGGHPWRRVVTKETAERIREMMKAVTEQGGTGTQAVPAGYPVAGKTGTAQVLDPETGTYSNERYTAVFTGFVPADDPRIVMTVVVHDPRKSIYGGVAAAPVFRKVAASALPHLGVLPRRDPPSPTAVVRRAAAPTAPAATSSPPAYASRNASEALLPDLCGRTLKSALKELSALGVTARFQGSGLVVEQDPPAGTALRDASEVRLVLEDHS